MFTMTTTRRQHPPAVGAVTLATEMRVATLAVGIATKKTAKVSVAELAAMVIMLKLTAT